jgi:hypothetical protein
MRRAQFQEHFSLKGTGVHVEAKIHECKRRGLQNLTAVIFILLQFQIM